VAKTPHEITLDVNVEPAMTALDNLREGALITIVFGEVMEEIFAARTQHGKQHHLPLGFGDSQGRMLAELDDAANVETVTYLQDVPNDGLEFLAKATCQYDPTWAKITFEEFAEALAAESLEDTRTELTQLAAMAVCSILALDAQQQAKIDARVEEAAE
jgi:hypothetical protein